MYVLTLSLRKCLGENDGGTDNNPKPDLDNINGQITINNPKPDLDNINAYSKFGLVIYSSYRPETKIWACLGQITA